MPATDSFTSSAAAVSSAAGAAIIGGDGSAVNTLYGNWRVKVTSRGVTVSKASSFGGTQGAVAWPVSKDDARALAHAILYVTG